MSRKNIDTSQVIQEFYTHTSYPDGKAQFVRYSIAWLYNDWEALQVCSMPSSKMYDTAWSALQWYNGMTGKKKRALLSCLARLGEHLVLRCIYPS